MSHKAQEAYNNNNNNNNIREKKYKQNGALINLKEVKELKEYNKKALA
jgi:hypothetical protein